MRRCASNHDFKARCSLELSEVALEPLVIDAPSLEHGAQWQGNTFLDLRQSVTQIMPSAETVQEDARAENASAH
jgi:hypothetical protein